MSQFAIGVLLIVIAITGNASAFGSFAFNNATSFVKWFIAIYIVKWCIFNAPPEARPATRTFGIGLTAGVILINQSQIRSLLKMASQEFETPINPDNGLKANVTGYSSSYDNGLNTGGNMATREQQLEFIQANLPYASQAAEALGTTPATVLAQSAYETGWGTSSAYQNLNNVAGINNPGSQTGEDYASYNNLAAGWQGYTNLLQSHRYSGAYGLTGTAFASAVNNAGYSTNPDYASEYAGVYNSVQSLMNNM